MSESSQSPKPAPQFSPQGYLPSAYRRPEYLEYLERATHAMRNLRLIVYAGMSSFVILAFYGFYLIYQLTTDLHRAVEQTALMTQQMQAMTRIMTNMDASVATMNGNAEAMRQTITLMNGEIGQLNTTVALMQHSASNLDRNIGPAMGTFNRVVPFNWLGGSQTIPPPYARP